MDVTHGLGEPRTLVSCSIDVVLFYVLLMCSYFMYYGCSSYVLCPPDNEYVSNWVISYEYFNLSLYVELNFKWVC